MNTSALQLPDMFLCSYAEGRHIRQTRMLILLCDKVVFKPLKLPIQSLLTFKTFNL